MSIRTEPATDTLSTDLLTSLAAAIIPGGAARVVARLDGGISCRMFVLELAGPAGDVRRVVLRMYGDWRWKTFPEIAVYESQTLALLRDRGIVAPEPLWQDAHGAIAGSPAILTTLLPGAPLLSPPATHVWLRGLAEGLASIHRGPWRAGDLAFLHHHDHHLDRLLATDTPDPDLAAMPYGIAVWSALRSLRPRLTPVVPTLLHGDYWSANVLWQGDRLTGVVDWEGAQRGDPGLDVGCCRLDLATQLGMDAADYFLECYEQTMGVSVPNLRFWDLWAISWVMPDPAECLPAYHAHGRTDLSAELIRARTRSFFEGALRRAAG